MLVPILLIGAGCGELKDPYAGLVGGGGTSGGGSGGGSGGTASEWLTLTNGSNAITQNNIGTDILLFYTPASKPQGNSGVPTDIANGTVSTAKGSSALMDNAQPFYFQNMPIEGVTPDTNDPHIAMRLLENELLKSGKRQLNDGPETSRVITQKRYEINSTYQFYGLDLANPNAKFSAKCVEISDEAYFFIQQGFENLITTNQWEQYKTGFKDIYSTIVDKFGPSGDVDRNGKIMIIFYNMEMGPNTIGYFYGGDKYDNVKTNDPNTDNRYSNEGDIFYMNTIYAADTGTTLAALSHEFQHITYFDSQYRKMEAGANPNNFMNDAWLNEGLSMLSSYYTGYAEVGSNNYNWIGHFLTDDYPSLSLTYWTANNYGYSALFTHYLNDRFGEGMAKILYESSFAGISAVENLMVINGLGRDFNALFNDFAQALYLSGTGLSTETKFNFTSLDLTIYQSQNSGRKGLKYSATIKTGANQELTLMPYNLALINSAGSVGEVGIPTVNDLRGYAAILQKK